MINLARYYAFFANHQFSADGCLQFFPNGWFATHEKAPSTSNLRVKIYDQNAILRLDFNNGRDIFVLFNTGYTIVKDVNKGGIVVYYLDKEVSFFEIKCIEHAHLTVVDGSALIIRVGNVFLSVLLTKAPDEGEECMVKLYRLDSQVVVLGADNRGNFSYRDVRNDVFILDITKKTKELKNVSDFKFLCRGRAIVYYNNGISELIQYGAYQACDVENNNLDNPLVLLKSGKPEGIKPLGKYAVVFEDSLIAETHKGRFISEYNDKLLKEVFSYVLFIKPYVIFNGRKKAFYPSDSGDCYDIDDKILFVFWYNNRFYPCLITKDLSFHEKYLFEAKVDVEYLDKLSQALIS